MRFFFHWFGSPSDVVVDEVATMSRRSASKYSRGRSPNQRHDKTDVVDDFKLLSLLGMASERRPTRSGGRMAQTS